MRIRVTRRQITLGLLAVIGGGSVTGWLLSDGDNTPIELDLPPVGNPFAPTYEVFLALSRIVLARPDLDEKIAQRLFALFMDEPWGPKHIGHAYAVLRKELARSYWGRDGQGPVSFLDLEPGERWFVSHLTTTWYLGVYYHERRPTQRVLYEQALMFDAIRGVLPIPFLENTGFGAWSDPPPGADKTKL